jgi:hypothetical protein
MGMGTLNSFGISKIKRMTCSWYLDKEVCIIAIQLLAQSVLKNLLNLVILPNIQSKKELAERCSALHETKALRTLP